MLRRRLRPEVRIKSSPVYPRSGGASCANGERVGSFVRRISWDPVRFHVRWCVFSSVSFDLRLSSLAMVAALVHWSFVALARRLPVRLLQQALLRQALPGSDDGGARTAVRLRLALVSVAVARWSIDLFIIFITLGPLCRSVEFCKKKLLFISLGFGFVGHAPCSSHSNSGVSIMRARILQLMCCPCHQQPSLNRE